MRSHDDNELSLFLLVVDEGGVVNICVILMVNLLSKSVSCLVVAVCVREGTFPMKRGMSKRIFSGDVMILFPSYVMCKQTFVFVYFSFLGHCEKELRVFS